MRPSALWWLSGLLFVTGIMMVQVRHEHRLAYAHLQEQEIRHDQLVDEWGQLLTEENLWAFPHRIEKDARDGLAMKKPAAEEVIYVDLEHTNQSGERLLVAGELP